MAAIINQETRVEVPPLNGVKLKIEAIGRCVVEETAEVESRNQLILGKWDHGPVHATTTAIKIK